MKKRNQQPRESYDLPIEVYARTKKEAVELIFRQINSKEKLAFHVDVRDPHRYHECTIDC